MNAIAIAQNLATACKEAHRLGGNAMCMKELDDFDEDTRLKKPRERFSFDIHDTGAVEAWSRALEEAAEK